MKSHISSHYCCRVTTIKRGIPPTHPPPPQYSYFTFKYKLWNTFFFNTNFRLFLENIKKSHFEVFLQGKNQNIGREGKGLERVREDEKYSKRDIWSSKMVLACHGLEHLLAELTSPSYILGWTRANFI
jgi:hypothetical protein